MHELQVLIGKLKEQFEQNSPASQMLVTLRQIEAELQHAPSESPTVNRSSTKVAVVMPMASKNGSYENRAVPNPAPAPGQKPVEVPPITQQQPPKKHEPWSFDPMREIPTLSHQQSSREINDVMGAAAPSLNCPSAI